MPYVHYVTDLKLSYTALFSTFLCVLRACIYANMRNKQNQKKKKKIVETLSQSEESSKSNNEKQFVIDKCFII